MMRNAFLEIHLSADTRHVYSELFNSYVVFLKWIQLLDSPCYCA
jgi:hypothetical protein